MDLSGASITFTAEHFDAIMNEGWHAHEWTVTGWWKSLPWRDGRAIQHALQQFAEGLLEDTDGTLRLPRPIWTNEALAQAFLMLGMLDKVTVDRPGFHAEASR